MAHVPILEAAGLHTNNNELSAVPNGALAVADNVVIRGKGVIEPRRGQKSLAGLPNYANQMFPFGSSSVIHTADNVVGVLIGSNVDERNGTVEAPGDYRIRSMESGGNVYFTSNRGIMKLETTTSDPVLAGAPKTADLEQFFTTSFDLGTTTAGFLNPGNRVAYRCVLVRKDANDNVLIGSPSGRCFALNVSTTYSTNVHISIRLPIGVEEGMYLRLYRTAQVESEIDPGDEMQLVKEAQLTTTHVNNRLYSFTDKQPDSLRGEFLYTNAISGETVLQANEPPPMAQDIVFWNQRAWYANTKQPQRLYLDLLGVGAGDTGATGLRLGDIIEISGQKFMPWDSSGSEIPTSGEYMIFSPYPTAAGYDLTIAQKIESAARGFVADINGIPALSYFDVPVRAYYTSGPSDVPGKFVVEAMEPNTAAFSATFDTYAFAISQLSRTDSTVTVTTQSPHGMEAGDTFSLSALVPHVSFPLGTKTVVAKTSALQFTYTEAGTATTVATTFTQRYTAKRLTPTAGLAWNPELPKSDGTSGFTVTSEAETEVNRLYYSKLQQPEAVPLVNYIDVGRKGSPILRILPLRERLFVFKPEGIYTVSGEAPFIVDLHDDTTHLIAPDTAVSVSNSIYCLSNQGVIQVSDAGVNIVSRAIEPSINQLFNPDVYESLKINSFGVSRETDRMYELWVPDLENNYVTAQAFVLNVLLGTWTRTTLRRTCGFVHPITDKLYMGDVDTFAVMTERKSYDSTDYVDTEYEDIFVSSVNTTNRTITVSAMDADLFSPGDLFYDSSLQTPWFIVESVDGTTITYRDEGNTFSTAPASVNLLKAIPCRVEWATQMAGNANETKHFNEVHFLFRKAHFIQGNATFGTDAVPTRSDVTFLGNSTDLSSVVDWSEYDIPFQRRVIIDSDHQVATFLRPGLDIAEAYAFWTLSGITINFNSGSIATGQ